MGYKELYFPVIILPYAYKFFGGMEATFLVGALARCTYRMSYINLIFLKYYMYLTLRTNYMFIYFVNSC
jgi:hypothetical protein